MVGFRSHNEVFSATEEGPSFLIDQQYLYQSSVLYNATDNEQELHKTIKSIHVKLGHGSHKGTVNQMEKETDIKVALVNIFCK